MNIFKQLFGASAPLDLRLVIEDGALLVDVRTPGEFAQGPVKGSVNIPLDLVACTENISNNPTEVEANMKKFAELNHLCNYEYHLINDKDVENGVIHFNQMQNMDIICIGTHGKGSLFHRSETEKLINHLYKPIISFHLKNPNK